VTAAALDAYKPDPLNRYPFGKRLRIRMVGLLSYAVLSVLGRTLRIEVDGWGNLEQVERDGKVPIYCLWHDRIFAGTYFWRSRGLVVMTSQSEDGEYIARFLKKFGYGTVRGSASRGGVGALVEMIRLMNRSRLPTAFTVDGPRGPRYEAKSGPVLLAKKTGNPMLPFSVECRKLWTLNSWDRFQIPHPFSRVKVFIAGPIYVPPDANDEDLDRKLRELQESLDELVAVGKRWTDQ